MTDVSHEDVLIIPAEWRAFRYLLNDGHVLDVWSPYRADSNDRKAVLDEAQRRWGGKKDDWRIEGVADLGPQPITNEETP
jgi:hypothetical protein